MCSTIMVCKTCRCCTAFSHHHRHTVCADVPTDTQPDQGHEAHTTSTALGAPAGHKASAAAAAVSAAIPPFVSTQLLLLLLVNPEQPRPHLVCQQHSSLSRGQYWQRQADRPRKPVALHFLCPDYCLAAGLCSYSLLLTGVTLFGDCWERRWQILQQAAAVSCKAQTGLVGVMCLSQAGRSPSGGCRQGGAAPLLHLRLMPAPSAVKALHCHVEALTK